MDDIISSYSLSPWEYALAIFLYAAYLCFVMFGGLKKRRVKPIKYAILAALMLYGVIELFDGYHGDASWVNFIFVTLLAVGKGIFMGKKKMVEYIDGKYYIHHDKKYIIWWAILFVAKLIVSNIFKTVFEGDVTLWQTVYYLALYYVARTVAVYAFNPCLYRKQRKEYQK